MASGVDCGSRGGGLGPNSATAAASSRQTPDSVRNSLVQLAAANSSNQQVGRNATPPVEKEGEVFRYEYVEDTVWGLFYSLRIKRQTTKKTLASVTFFMS